MFSEGDTIKRQSVTIAARQWSIAEPVHGLARTTSREDLTVPPQETLNTYPRGDTGGSVGEMLSAFDEATSPRSCERQLAEE